MKIVLKNICWGAFLGCLLLLTTAFTPVATHNAPDPNCTVEIHYPDGSLAHNIEVTTDVTGGVFCVGGRTFETNDEGVVTIYWVEGCKLTGLFIKGKKYDVTYENKGSYTLTLKE